METLLLDVRHNLVEGFPWLALQFQGRVGVTGIKISKCCGHGSRRSYIRVTDQLPRSDQQLFDSGKLLWRFSGSNQNINININNPVHGSNVLIQTESNDGILQLTEVEIL